MDRVLFVIANAGKQLMHAQALNTHNLANASTVGFQQDLANFRAQLISGPGYASRAYATAESAGLSFDKGEIQSTGRPLDVAVSGDGLIVVQAADGSEAFTRAGNLKVNINGQLLTGADHPVLGENGPIVIPEYEHLEIGADGTISVRPIGQQPGTLAEVGRIRLVSADHRNLEKGSDGLIRTKDQTVAQPAADAQLISGALESSNVNAVEAMVNMISLARQFEVSVKIMETAQTMDEQGARILDLG
jgi:flagellar basal-body rod protein FlgF